MINIIKSELYTLFKDRILRLIILGVLFLQCFIHIYMYYSEMTDFVVDGSILSSTLSDFIVYAYYSIVTFPFLLLIYLVCHIVADDCRDKTINHEILCGHSRRVIFMSRLTVTLICVLLCLFIQIAPLIPIGIIAGWGDAIPFTGFLSRVFSSAICYMRFGAVMFFVSVVIKNNYFAALSGIIIYTLEATLSCYSALGESEVAGEGWLSTVDLTVASMFDSWRTYSLDLKNYIIYVCEIDVPHLLTMTLISLAVSITFIALAYRYFKADDIN